MATARAMVVTIGDEILIGQVLDTNSRDIARRLHSLGFRVERMASIGDNASDLEQVLRRATRSFDLVVFTGGLGPTDDDKTKGILARHFGSPLAQDPESLRIVQDHMERRTGRRELNPRDQSQAMLPACCRPLRNQVGTAPGMLFDNATTGGAVLVFLPGVPSEVRWLMENRVEPALAELFDVSPLGYDTFHVGGIAESELAILLEPWESRLPDAWRPAYLPAHGVIRLRTPRPAATGDHDTDAREAERYRQAVDELVALLGRHLLGQGDDDAPALLAKMLEQRGLTLSTAESCTGGALAAALVARPGASRYFAGSVVAYSNDLKTKILGVTTETLARHGAVSRETAEQMARGVCQATGSRAGIATTGIAGPDGGTPKKPVGTIWIAVSVDGQTASQKITAGNTRDANITRAVNTAVLFLIRFLQENRNN